MSEQEAPAIADESTEEAELPLFEDLGLIEPVLTAVEKQGYKNPTKIQAEAIPQIIDGRDLIGSSQTGTGKTAAFALPVISRLKKSGKFRCLVLEPTRELAEQVAKSFRTYAQDTDLKVLLIQGGVGYTKQKEALNKGVDIVVATPGRLLDHYKQRSINFKDLQVLVLDEVDRMLDMGFLPDVRRIVQYTPKKRQTLFFSATIPGEIDRLAKWALKDPYAIDVGQRRSAAETVNHCLYPVAREQKIEILSRLLNDADYNCVLIFTETKLDAEVVARKLEAQGHVVHTLHSDRSQRERREALEGFKTGKFEILIATDVAGRGLDITGITHVINYDVPRNPENYVHRIGRTGRANTEGDAYTLFSADEINEVKGIEAYIEQPLERRTIEGFEYAFTTLLQGDKPAPTTRKRRNRGYSNSSMPQFGRRRR